MQHPRAASIALALAGGLLVVPLAGAQDATPDAKKLFLDNCARCHGETGDGKGWTELDRPARSFRDGGFSYGNTSEALFRTISMGIPGTPMPGFDTSNSEAERRALAAYVLTLGPEIREVSEAETILVVGDRAQIARGLLPPIAEGAIERPRGLLIGTPDGFTFEYTTDDVRLLGVRLGGFVRRTDWTGRGGTPLEPLGNVVHLMESGMPEPVFRLDDQEHTPLRAELESTWVRGAEAGLTYRLRDAGGRLRARVEETCHPVVTSFATGFARDQTLSGGDVSGTVRLRAAAFGSARRVSPLEEPPGSGVTWSVHALEDGRFACLGTVIPAKGRSIERSNGVTEVLVALRPSSVETVETIQLVLTEWSDELWAKLHEEVRR